MFQCRWIRPGPQYVVDFFRRVLGFVPLLMWGIWYSAVPYKVRADVSPCFWLPMVVLFSPSRHHLQISQCANKSMCQQVNVQKRQCANKLMSLSLQLFVVTNEQTSQRANKPMCQDRSLRTCSLGCSMAQHSSGFADMALVDCDCFLASSLQVYFAHVLSLAVC